MRLFTLFLLLFAALQLVACVSNSTTAYPTYLDYHKVYDNFPRMSSMGFAIKPPAGRGWFEAQVDSELLYRKKVGKNDYAILSKATQLVFPSPDVSYATLERVIRQRQGEFLNNPRYQKPNLTISRAEGRPSCAFYSLEYDDHGNDRVAASSVVHVVSRGLLCSHPDMPQNGIELSYQEQRLNNATALSFRGEGEAFLNSLVMRPLYTAARPVQASPATR